MAAAARWSDRAPRLCDRGYVSVPTIAREARVLRHPQGMGVDASRPPDVRRANCSPVRGDARRNAVSNLAAVKGSSMSNELVLVVDDEPEISDIVARVLQRDQYRVLIATSAPDALRIMA